MLRSTLCKAPATLSDIVFQDFSTHGRMSVDQFKKLCAVKLKYKDVEEDEFSATFVKMDSGGKGYLNSKDFIEWWKMQDMRYDCLKFQSEDQRDEVRRIKKSFFQGTGGLGTMTPEQFRLKCYISGYCLSDDELTEAFMELDKDNSGAVDFVEYLRWRVREDRFAHLQHDEECDAIAAYVHQVGDYFRIYDTELKGHLDRNHFEPLYQHLAEHGQVDDDMTPVMRKIDPKGHGHVSFNDFIRWYTSDTTQPDSDEHKVSNDSECSHSGPSDELPLRMAGQGGA
jgi:Ca2+-binding EF-hand superfamily protein